MVPIMRAFSDPSYRRIVAVMGAQMGKTEAFWNVIGWRLDDDPTPILYVGPTQKLTESMSSDRVMKMLRSVPSLWDKLEKGKKNKITEKFIGGVRLGFAWAGSPTELAGHPAGLVLLDERDRMENSVGGEGDPGELAEARIATFPDGKLAVVSTPTEGTVDVARHEATGIEHWQVGDAVESPIWRLWQEGSRHEWAVPCPECGDYFVPRFRHLHWPKDSTPHQALHAAALTCINCGGLIQHAQMHAMNAAGRFVAPGQRIEKDGTVTGEAPATEAASFWVSGLCSPWQTFGQRARSFLSAVRSGDPDRIRTVLNTRFGELYAERGEAPTWDRVMELRADYASKEVPEGVLFLTAGVDVQKDRLVYVVRGWTHHMGAYLIEFGELWGDTDQPDVWTLLADYLRTDYGGRQIRLTMVDCGYRPEMVFAFCRAHPIASPARGYQKLTAPIRATLQDVTANGKTIKRGVQVWNVDTDYFKQLIHSRIEWPLDQPGAWRLPVDVSEEYARQIIAESRVPLPSGGMIWKRHDKDNHALDAEVYAAAAARRLGVDRLRAPAAPAPAATDQPAMPRPPAQPVRRIMSRGRFA
jgi:phage terminase large subunit GpA-like protein